MGLGAQRHGREPVACVGADLKGPLGMRTPIAKLRAQLLLDSAKTLAPASPGTDRSDDVVRPTRNGFIGKSDARW